MRVGKDDVDVRMEIPGAVIRQRLNFGDASGFDTISGECFTLSAGVDTAPLFEGLEGGVCQCPHWGYVLHGQLTTTDTAGVEETVRTGDLFYWPPGHNVKVESDAEIVMFSPQREHSHVIEHMIEKVQGITPLWLGSPIVHPTKQRMLDAGLTMLLEHGYNDLSVQELLAVTRIPKGSFYHHFQDKEDFALEAVDEYMRRVHAGLDACLGDDAVPPLERVRRFFELTLLSYEREGYRGCLLGALGQELSGVSEVFRHKIAGCLDEMVERIAACLELARERGDLPIESEPRRTASLLVDCWEGAALRSRLRGNAAPLTAMLEFYFQSALGADGIEVGV